MFADIDPETGAVTQLTQTGFDVEGAEEGKSGVFIRFSKDVGKTWYKEIQVPQWKGLNEANLQRAKNGNLVAAIRTDGCPRFDKWGFNDHYCGLVVSVSKDNGNTWSQPNRLYDWGRHHQSLVIMPDGTMVMTYVVRAGYCKSDDGSKQYGIEAIVSRDNGETWDLDHKYILADWVGRFGDPTSQATSSLALPDGSILTVFGGGFGNTRENASRPATIVRWRLSDKPAKFGGPITDAYYDLKLRNEYDPAPKTNVKIAGEAK
jgi:Neuraminidase (sialidase)